MKPVIRNLSQVGDPKQQWTADEIHEIILFFRDQYFPVHDFLEEQGVPRTIKHDIYEDRQRELLERVKVWGESRYLAGLKEARNE